VWKTRDALSFIMPVDGQCWREGHAHDEGEVWGRQREGLVRQISINIMDSKRINNMAESAP
jgi:hypothetical protein